MAAVFEHPYPGTALVVAGPGAVARLAQVCDRLGVRRAVVVTGRTLATRTPVVRRVEEVLAGRHAATFAAMGEHVPSSSVDDVVALLEEHAADALVSVGGGSPIDGAKVAAHRRDGGSTLHVAVPTTLSAAEFTGIAGVTDETTRVKGGVAGPALAPRAVLLDAELTLDTPARLWLSTGVRALDHAVETVYAPEQDDYAAALALEAARRLRTLLPRSAAAPDDVAPRHGLQVAAWLSAAGLGVVTTAPSHPLGRLLGPFARVGHGITSCLLLAPAVAWMARRHPERVAPLCDVFSVRRPDDVAAAVRELVVALGLPVTMEAAGVDDAAVERLLGEVPEEWAEVVEAARTA